MSSRADISDDTILFPCLFGATTQLMYYDRVYPETVEISSCLSALAFDENAFEE